MIKKAPFGVFFLLQNGGYILDKPVVVLSPLLMAIPNAENFVFLLDNIKKLHYLLNDSLT